MINLKTRTEYSFRYAYGKIKDIISKSDQIAVITDRNNTFGHIPFWNECKKQNKQAILGVELSFVDDASLKVRQTPYFVTLLAINQAGLSKIYELTSKATTQKYYFNRLSFSELQTLPQEDLVVIFEDAKIGKWLLNRRNTYYGISILSNYSDYISLHSSFEILAISANLYDIAEHEELYQIILGNGQYEDRHLPSHLLSEAEWRNNITFLTEEQKNKAVNNINTITGLIQPISFNQAILPHQNKEKSLKDLCIEGAKERNIDLEDPIYQARLEKEIDLIHKKNYADYFYLVRDLVLYAKQHMLVGPARGSSAGSLVCYLLFITDIDPIPFGLIFERFIDLNRFDLPDIDIDFQDTKRDMCLSYLKEKYGKNCVAKLGTVSKYKPKSILTELAKILQIPSWEIQELKDAIVTRSGGDVRAENCLEDTFTESEVGKVFLEKYPELKYSQYIESHNRHFGQHAAGIVVSENPITEYCSFDSATDSCMLDKHDAETVNLLKMDCLGLRTLSVIQECLDLIGKDRTWLINYPFEDQKAFDVINDRKYYGIFQFEGYALQSISKQLDIRTFNDVCLITALARPGTLISGGTARYIKARQDNVPDYLPLCEEYTKDTLGIIVYQEQVLNIVRNIGCLSWEDTSTLRKALSKSYGEEFFNKFWEKFKEGAKKKHCMEEKTARKIWDNVNSMGSWAFNKSHSVAYGLISYQCMVLKAYYPLEFALATLKNSKSEDQTVQILKELDREGYKYKPFDKDLSQVDWSIQDRVLIGGLINIKGIGITKAKKIISKRKKEKELTVAERKLLYNAVTPFDSVFEFRDKFTAFYENWNLWFRNPNILIKDIDDSGGEVRVLCKIVSTKLRDMNEPINIKKRGGKEITDGKVKFLDLKFSDDTDTILGRINRELFDKYGADIINNHKIGDYYILKGKSCNGFRYLIIEHIQRITPEEVQEKINN